jgi:hypothetical protein
MFLNRHLYILLLSIAFIGIVVWSQRPANVVTAMAGGDCSHNSCDIVKQYFQRMDYRQFDSARKMLAQNAPEDVRQLEKTLADNPFLSIQKIEIQPADDGSLFVKITYGSAIDPRETVNYRVEVSQADSGLLITSLKRSDL